MLANAGGLVYGTILVATLLSAESAQRETYLKTVAAVVIALVIYWLSIAYAEFTGERIQRGEHFAYAAFARSASRELTLLYGATVPLVVLLVGWAVGAALTSAVSAAIWTAAAIIVATEIVIGIKSELRGRDLARQSAFGALLGLAVIALRLLLH